MGRPQKFEIEEVLDRATDLFWQRGLDAVTTRDLEAALELRAPAIYRKFESKDGLFIRCVNHYIDTVIARRIRVIFDNAEDPLKALQRFFTTTMAPTGDEPRLRGCLLANTATHANAHIPEVQEAILRGWGMIHTAFEEQVVCAQAAGQVDPTLDAEAVGQALIMSLQGLLTMVRAGFTDLEPGINATFRLLLEPNEKN